MNVTLPCKQGFLCIRGPITKDSPCQLTSVRSVTQSRSSVLKYLSHGTSEEATLPCLPAVD